MTLDDNLTRLQTRIVKLLTERGDWVGREEIAVALRCGRSALLEALNFLVDCRPELVERWIPEGQNHHKHFFRRFDESKPRPPGSVDQARFNTWPLAQALGGLGYRRGAAQWLP